MDAKFHSQAGTMEASCGRSAELMIESQGMTSYIREMSVMAPDNFNVSLETAYRRIPRQS